MAYGGPILVYGYQKKSTELLDILVGNRSKKCTDPRDKVYAVLGLLENLDQAFPIKYDISIRSLFIDVVAHIIKTTRRLDVLCASTTLLDRRNVFSIPTWVSHVILFNLIDFLS